jgi:hypothetical protein
MNVQDVKARGAAPLRTPTGLESGAVQNISGALTAVLA